MNRTANYEITAENLRRVLITDVGPWDRYKTVTNAAKEVVEELKDMLKGRKLFYVDSEGDLDELLIKNGKFAGFAPIS